MKSATPTTYYAPPSLTEHQSNQHVKRIGLLIVMWLFFIGMIAFNAASQLIPLYGTTMLEVSNGFFVLFKPAGFTFAIWSLIYVGLLVWMIAFTRYLMSIDTSRDTKHTAHQAAPSAAANSYESASVGAHHPHYARLMVYNETTPPRIWAMGGLFILSCALNISWLIAWHLYAHATSIVLIGALLITLIALTRTTHSYFADASWGATDNARSSRLNKAALYAPLSLYLGWIIVATIANITFVATFMNSAFATLDLVNTIALILLAVALVLIGAFVRYAFHDLVMPAVFVWSLVGVGFNLMPLTGALAATYFALAVVLVLAAYVPYQRIANHAHATPARDAA